MAIKKSKYIIIINNNLTKENLELILSIASLEHEVSLLLLQYTGLQLINNNLQQELEALALFAITIYLENNIIEQFNNWAILTNINNKFKINNLSLKNLNNLYNNHDFIICC